MVFLDWEFIALCRRHRHRLRFGGAKMFPGAICFSGSGRMLLDLARPKNAMSPRFWQFRCRFGLIDGEKYRNPRSMNFQRATTLRERILFSLFSARSSLSCPSIIPHYWQRQHGNSSSSRSRSYWRRKEDPLETTPFVRL